MTSTIQTSYNNESGNFSFIVNKSYNVIVIGFNFGKPADFSTLKSDIHLSLVTLLIITFLGRLTLFSTS